MTDRPDRFKTIALQYPVEYGDTVISELKIRRPRGKQLRRLELATLDNASFGFFMDLAADLSGQTPELFNLMEAEDVTTCLETVKDFLEVINQPSTGVSLS